MNRKPIINPDPTKEMWEWPNGSATVISTMGELAVYKAILHCYIKVHNSSKYFYLCQQRVQNSKNEKVIQRNRNLMKENVLNAEFYYEKLLALKQHSKDMGFHFPTSFEETKEIINAKKRRHNSFKERR